MDEHNITETLGEHKKEAIEEKKSIENEIRFVYQDTCYNRKSTILVNYVDRIIKDFPTPSERYYDIRLIKGEGRRSFFGEVCDQCIMFHSNRICLLTIAPTHPVVTLNKTVDKIDFQFEGYEKIDRTTSKPQGKNKRGSQKLQKNSPICAIICSDESKYIVTACMNAKLIEVNQALSTKPDLIRRKPLSLGYIAILQPNNFDKLDEFKNSYPKLGEDVGNVIEKID